MGCEILLHTSRKNRSSLNGSFGSFFYLGANTKLSAEKQSLNLCLTNLCFVNEPGN